MTIDELSIEAVKELAWMDCLRTNKKTIAVGVVKKILEKFQEQNKPKTLGS